MLYLSRLLAAPVMNIGGELYGRIDDVVVRAPLESAQNFPVVIGVMVRERGTRTVVYLPIDQLEEVTDRHVLIAGSGQNHKTHLPEGDGILSLKKSVIDKQIVDLSGVRIVRVNDVYLSRIRGVLHVVSLDVSNQALFRRLGIPSLLLRKSRANVLEWKDIQVIGNRLKVSRGASEIVKLHPADIANIVEQLNVKRGSMLLQSLDHETAARVLEEVQPDVQRLLVTSLGPERAVSLMARMSIDELVDLIQQLPSSQAKAIIERLPNSSTVKHVEHILAYDEDTAGGLMTTEFVSASPTDSVEMVMNKIKSVSEQFRSISFVYILDADHRYRGVVSLRKLIVTAGTTSMETILENADKIPTVTPDWSVPSVGREMTKYNLHTIAVLDNSNRLLGVITADDIMRRIFPKA